MVSSERAGHSRRPALRVQGLASPAITGTISRELRLPYVGKWIGLRLAAYRTDVVGSRTVCLWRDKRVKPGDRLYQGAWHASSRSELISLPPRGARYFLLRENAGRPAAGCIRGYRLHKPSLQCRRRGGRRVDGGWRRLECRDIRRRIQGIHLVG